jgi:hypothetical protein
MGIVNVHAITVALTIVLGGPITVDVYPTFTVPLEIPFRPPLPADVSEHAKVSVGAIALPHLVLHDPTLDAYQLREVMAHESIHMQHWEAFGPAFVGMYALTGGQPFEDYLGGEMYVPPAELRQCPMLRFHSETGPAFMPCWRF